MKSIDNPIKIPYNSLNRLYSQYIPTRQTIYSGRIDSCSTSSTPTPIDLVFEVLLLYNLEDDRRTKVDTYSVLSVLEICLVDLSERTIEVRENPKANKSWDRYVLYTWGEVIQSPVLGISVELFL